MLGEWGEGGGGFFTLHRGGRKSWVGSFQQQRRGFLAQTAGRGAGPTWETGCAPGGSGGSSSACCCWRWCAGCCTGGWSRTRCTNSSRGRRRWRSSTSSTKSRSRLSSKVNTLISDLTPLKRLWFLFYLIYYLLLSCLHLRVNSRT